MKKYILWDHDGVLVDTEHWYFRATQRALAELGVALDKQAYLQRMVHGLSSWELALAAGIEEDVVIRKRLQRDIYYREHLRRENIEIPGVMPVLQALSKTHGMAIVTTSKGADFDVIHKSRNITSYMDFVLLREDYNASKPDPEPYLLAVSRFDAKAEDCLVVEDSRRGLKSAIAAGIDCAIVYNEFTSTHDFTGAKYLLNSIGDLPGILDVDFG